jgi:hypothetical protein
MRSQVQGSPFRVTFLPVRRTQTGLNILKSFYSHAFFIQSSRINGFRFSFNPEPLNP